MVEKTRTVNRDLYLRRCLDCGYDGALLQHGSADRCAFCGCDLRARPARSYAEMEGLAPADAAVAPPVTERRAGGAIQRWLTFLCLVLGGVALVLYLLGEAMP